MVSALSCTHRLLPPAQLSFKLVPRPVHAGDVLGDLVAAQQQSGLQLLHQLGTLGQLGLQLVHFILGSLCHLAHLLQARGPRWEYFTVLFSVCVCVVCVCSYQPLKSVRGKKACSRIDIMGV